jgi:hypothetical protein
LDSISKRGSDVSSSRFSTSKSSARESHNAVVEPGRVSK